MNTLSQPKSTVQVIGQFRHQIQEEAFVNTQIPVFANMHNEYHLIVAVGDGFIGVTALVEHKDNTKEVFFNQYQWHFDAKSGEGHWRLLEHQHLLRESK